MFSFVFLGDKPHAKHMQPKTPQEARAFIQQAGYVTLAYLLILLAIQPFETPMLFDVAVLLVGGIGAIRGTRWSMPLLVIYWLVNMLSLVVLGEFTGIGLVALIFMLALVRGTIAWRYLKDNPTEV